MRRRVRRRIDEDDDLDDLGGDDDDAILVELPKGDLDSNSRWRCDLTATMRMPRGAEFA